MAGTWNSLNLLIIVGVTACAVSQASAEAGYSDAITARTQKNNGTTGQWFEIKTSDWAFYEGEAAAQYNLGAIPAGTKVEVLKMNKQMARVRLPDGRVVFVRNRLLESSSAPSAQEKTSQAARTSQIGKTKLHGGNPHARPSQADLSQTTTPAKEEPARIVEQTPSLATRGLPAATGVTSPTGVRVIPLPTATGPASIPLPNANGTVVATAPTGTLTAPTGDRNPIVATTGFTAATSPTGRIPVPERRPERQDVAANGACDPKKQWQSPVRQTYRITDCLGSARDGGGRRHAGVDIAGGTPGMQGIPIYPTASGRVIRAGHNGGYGCFVEIKHKNCPDTIAKWRRDSGCITRYAHLATKKVTYKDRKGRTKTKRTCDVPEVNAEVTPCTRIGGMSGTGSSGSSRDYASHLHFELRDDSTSVAYNPNTLLASLRSSPHFKSAGSASCKASNGLDGANTLLLNAGRIDPVDGVREGRN